MRREESNITYAVFMYRILRLEPYRGPDERWRGCPAVYYKNLTDSFQEHHHIFKPKQTFPWQKLRVDEIYTIVSCRFGAGESWHFLYAFPLEGVQPIINSQLEAHLAERFGERIGI